MAKEKKRIWVFIARLMAMVATLSAAIVMGTSREDSSVYGISIHARFYYELSFRCDIDLLMCFVHIIDSCFVNVYANETLICVVKTWCRYFVGANAAVAAYSFVVLFVPSNSKLWRLVVTLDLVHKIYLPLHTFVASLLFNSSFVMNKLSGRSIAITNK